MKSETFRDRLQRQIALEQESRALGAERYRSSRPMPWRNDPSAADEEADLPPGRQLLRLALKPTADAIREFTDRVNHGGGARTPESSHILNELGAEEAAYLIGRVVLSATVEQKKLTATAIAVADALIEHIQMARLTKVNRHAAKGVLRNQQTGVRSSKKRRAIQHIFERLGVDRTFPLATRIRTGVKAIELFCDATGLFVIESRGLQTKYVRPTEAVHQWLEQQHARCELLEPINLPMIMPPRRWTSPFKGGYVTRTPGTRLVKQSNAAYHEDLRHQMMNAVYDAVNSIQETAWRINTPILNIIREIWDGGGVLGGLPAREPETLPGRPDDYDINEEAKKRWKRDAADVHDRNSKLVSARLAMSQRLWVGAKFASEEAIYFPHSLDFRGRVYPLATGGPHPQGDDVAKALLTFAEGHPITDAGAHWLAVHLAGLFGHDKISFEERVDWVFANEAAILDSAADPLDGQRFWATADSPFMALAACMEWAGYVREGADFISHLPVALDGSNSGLQHFSALLRDPIGAAAVNLEPSDRPRDIYADVAALVQAQVDQSSDPIAAIWRGKVNRKTAKRPVMTYVYSATRYGFHDMIFQTLRELDAEGPYLDGDNYAASLFLSGAMWEGLQNTVVAASSAMDWLRSVSRIVTSAGLPLRWTTPTGLPVLQSYYSRKSGSVNVTHKGKVFRLQVKNETKRLDSRRQANGISPNFIHAMDASHLMSVANRCHDNGIRALAVVHDSFAVHAARAFELGTILRETFVDLYQTNWLEVLRDEIAEQLPPEIAVTLPPVPALGSFDINRVLSSQYLFA
ncbi:DNA-directed RNA polymerase [Brevundimonas diminuta]|uniref:DNA-directed RNA polymerase n=1 Tax=Brevundimonas diminuta TaxID=293 RepID=UPI001F5799C3|nr:DNA-directed RNA polymerase [Brevundimonas diminuta]